MGVEELKIENFPIQKFSKRQSKLNFQVKTTKENKTKNCRKMNPFLSFFFIRLRKKYKRDTNTTIYNIFQANFIE